MTGFYQFRQSNSDGYIITDETCGIGEYVYIWGKSWSAAQKRAQAIGLFSLPVCRCCGARFTFLDKYDHPMKEGQEDSFFSMERKITIFIHLPSKAVKSLVIDNSNTRAKTVNYTWTEEAVSIK